MDVKKLVEALNELSNEKDIDREVIIQALEETIAQAARRKFPNYDSLDAAFNQQEGVIELFHYKMVVDRLTDPDNEISFEEARQIDAEAELGDELEYEIEFNEFQDLLAQTSRHILFQRIREIERENILKKYQDKVMDIVHGTVGRVDRAQATVLLDNKVEAVLDRREQIAGEKLQPRDHVRSLLLKIGEENKSSSLQLSRTHPVFLKRLLESEIPELYEGTIEIINVAREPGKRAKVSVTSSDPDIDAIGACVGQGGSRIQPIVSELCDEKIDIIEFSSDIMTYITRALAPAQISTIVVNTEERTAEVEVDSDQLSLAIGRQGQNVRLASKLTNYRINVFSSLNQAEDGGEVDLDEVYEQTKSAAKAAELEVAQASAKAAEAQPAGDDAPAAKVEKTSGDAPPAAKVAKTSGDDAPAAKVAKTSGDDAPAAKVEKTSGDETLKAEVPTSASESDDSQTPDAEASPKKQKTSKKAQPPAETESTEAKADA